LDRRSLSSNRPASRTSSPRTAPFLGPRGSAFGPLLLLVPLLLAQVLILKPYYQVNDDLFKTFFIKGVGTELEPTEFIGYSNPLLGHLLGALYQAAPGIPWYGGFLVLAQTLGLWALLWAAWLTPGRPFKGLLFLAAYLCFYVNLFTSLQFTMTSSLAAQGALFLAGTLWRTREGGKRPWAWAFAGALAVISVIIRLDSFVLTLLCALPFLIMTAQSGRDPSWKAFWKDRRVFLSALGLLLASCALYEFAWYRCDPAWREFQAFDRERVEMQDYRIHAYDERTKPFFDRADWTQNDYEMFKDWYFMDPVRHSAGTLRELKRNFPRFGTAGKPSTYPDFPAMLRDHWVKAGLSLTLVFLIFWPPSERKALLAQTTWVLGILALLFYVLRVPDRVAWPLIALPLGAALLGARPPSFPRPKGPRGDLLPLAGILLLVLCFFLGGRSFLEYQGSNQVRRTLEERLKADVQRLGPKKDQLYVVWDSSFPFEGYSAWDDLESFRDFHIFTLAVYQRAPNAAKMLEKFGLRDLFRDLVDRPDVFLICTPLEGAMYRKYMMEKHRMQVYAERYYEGNYFKAYRIHSRPPWAKGPGSPRGK